MYVYHLPLRFAPVCQQLADVSLCGEIVSSPPFWMVECQLHVNHDEQGVLRQGIH
jgi:hypothetical protein